MSRRLAGFALALFLMRASSAAAVTPALEGEWIGGFDTHDGTVFIAAQFKPEGEKVTGQIDLPLRGDHQVPLTNISAKDTRVSFEVPAAQGNLLFEGRRQQGTMTGSVRQARSSGRFELIKLMPASRETIAEIGGDYELEPGRVILISRSAQGALYLDHAAGRMGVLYPIAERTFVSGPSLLAGYPVELTVTFDRAIDGASPALTWQAKGQPAQRAARRTFYTTEVVNFANQSGTGRIAGSLLMPTGPGPHPAIVMIHGSGPVSRDALHPYADVFARNGIAVLITDKRGIGGSTGNWARATFADLADDALAGVGFLRTRAGINPRQIGLQGTSLGGWVAPLAATRSSDIAFVIVESAPALTPLEHERLRVRSQMRADGFAPLDIMIALAFMDEKFEVARTGKGWDRLMEAAGRGDRAGWISYVNPPSSLESLQWHWANILSYDPLPALERLTCPVLVLYGGLDTIVPASENRKRMEAVLKRAGTRDATIKVFEQANHGFFAAITGGKREAGSLKSLVPGYLNARVDWLRQRVTVSNAVATTPAPASGVVAPLSDADADDTVPIPGSGPYVPEPPENLSHESLSSGFVGSEMVAVPRRYASPGPHSDRSSLRSL